VDSENAVIRLECEAGKYVDAVGPLVGIALLIACRVPFSHIFEIDADMLAQDMTPKSRPAGLKPMMKLGGGGHRRGRPGGKGGGLRGRSRTVEGALFTARGRKWPTTGPKGRWHPKKRADRRQTAQNLHFPKEAAGQVSALARVPRPRCSTEHNKLIMARLASSSLRFITTPGEPLNASGFLDSCDEEARGHKQSRLLLI